MKADQDNITHQPQSHSKPGQINLAGCCMKSDALSTAEEERGVESETKGW